MEQGLPVPAFVFNHVSHQPLAPDAMFPAGSSELGARFIRLATGVTIRVVSAGPESGQPVVMLHGWGASAYMFRHTLRDLGAAGFRAIAADLRGMGRSDKPRGDDAYSLNNYLADLDSLLSALRVERAALIGQSMGAGIALHFALREPSRVSHLALINPVGLVPIGALPFARLSPQWLLDALGPRAAPRWLIEFTLRQIAYGRSERVTEHDIDEYWSPIQLPGTVSAVRAALSQFEWRPLSDDELASLAVPAVVIVGDSDRLIHNTAGAVGKLRGAQLWQWEGGHCVHEEHPDEVDSRLVRFLREVDGQGSGR